MCAGEPSPEQLRHVVGREHADRKGRRPFPDPLHRLERSHVRRLLYLDVTAINGSGLIESGAGLKRARCRV